MFVQVNENLLAPGAFIEFTGIGHSRLLYCHDGGLHITRNDNLVPDELEAAKANIYQGYTECRSHVDGASIIQIELFEHNDPSDDPITEGLGITTKDLWQGHIGIDYPCHLHAYAMTLSPNTLYDIGHHDYHQLIIFINADGEYNIDSATAKKLHTGTILHHAAGDVAITINSKNERVWAIIAMFAYDDIIGALPQNDTVAYIPLCHNLLP